MVDKKIINKKIVSKPKKSALDLDREITRKGMEWSSPEMERRQKRTARALEEEKKISKENASSLTRGLKGFLVGSSAMDAQDAKERNERARVRNNKEKEDEKAIKEMLRKRR